MTLLAKFCGARMLGVLTRRGGAIMATSTAVAGLSMIKRYLGCPRSRIVAQFTGICGLWMSGHLVRQAVATGGNTRCDGYLRMLKR